MRAIALLSFFKLRNSLRTAFTDPRKLIPLIILVGFFGLSIFVGSFGGGGAPPSQNAATLNPTALRVVATLTIILLALATVDSGLGDALLALSRADVDYLFPSPVSRRVVLAYRLPSLLFSALFQGFFLLFAFKMATNMVTPSARDMGPEVSPGWVPTAALALCVGTYLNLALFVAMAAPSRQVIRKYHTAGIIGFALIMAAIGWQKGWAGMSAAVDSAFIRILFFPVTLASDALVSFAFHRPTGASIGWLLLAYLGSFIPMFATNANWYEQSIVSTDRIASFRKAAQGGYASMMAAKAQTHQHRARREYTIRPFGEGAVALFWAHLCAAGKRPTANFITPLLIGVGIGLFAAATQAQDAAMAYVVLGVMCLYGSMLFLGAARTASEAAVRRRELVAPLPIRGWESVSADLAVPMVSLLLFSFGTSAVLLVARVAYMPLVVFGLLVLFPLRTAARMALQYTLVLGYPDFSDKLQQLLGQFAYWLFAAPLIAGEIVLCLPAIFLKSLWLGAVTLAAFEGGLVFLLVALAGKASERAVATGEPVRIFSIVGIRRKKRPEVRA
ncbi:putative ABC exporter domain-containing protein [Fimbriimonas ginsengisoli]|uniref:ABC-2 type transport system permease protein n=1 Tax=Fimbriimonas ginsengisoli Gsoil 348 TaxID=661478 RepID=A0A068NTL1_FIMGI|nr:putative ABC exporter domain-containing protein [Fimbriimonas ginsengisoli]AIE84949.1 hypothetical protein OP10G_1581 [Fimbriimonas ginsengisoli Gsoil 348]